MHIKILSDILPYRLFIAIDLKSSKPLSTPFCMPLSIPKKSKTPPHLKSSDNDGLSMVVAMSCAKTIIKPEIRVPKITENLVVIMYIDGIRCD